MKVIFDFAMKNDDDAKGRLEYNMGADGSAAGIMRRRITSTVILIY